MMPASLLPIVKPEAASPEVLQQVTDFDLTGIDDWAAAAGQLSTEFRFVLISSGVSLEFQAILFSMGVTELEVFASLADDRASFRTFVASSMAWVACPCI